MRKRYLKDFKAKVAIEAVRSEKTLQELRDLGVTRKQIRRILSWRLSNTMDTEFCVSALREAIDRYGIPAIFNTDQGSQFTSKVFVEVLESYGIGISMDGGNRALDNIYILCSGIRNPQDS
jgi:hypothetical protein